MSTETRDEMTRDGCERCQLRCYRFEGESELLSQGFAEAFPFRLPSFLASSVAQSRISDYFFSHLFMLLFPLQTRQLSVFNFSDLIPTLFTLDTKLIYIQKRGGGTFYKRKHGNPSNFFSRRKFQDPRFSNFART